MLSLDTVIESLTQNKVFTAIKPGRYEQAASLKPMQYSFPSMTRPTPVVLPLSVPAPAPAPAPAPPPVAAAEQLDLKTETYTLPKLRTFKLALLQEIATKLDIDINVIGANSKSKPKTRDTLITEIHAEQEKRTSNNN